MILYRAIANSEDRIVLLCLSQSALYSSDNHADTSAWFASTKYLQLDQIIYRINRIP